MNDAADLEGMGNGIGCGIGGGGNENAEIAEKIGRMRICPIILAGWTFMMELLMADGNVGRDMPENNGKDADWMIWGRIERNGKLIAREEISAEMA